MELDEVMTRVLGRHIRLIALCVALGLLAVWLVHRDDQRQYEATVRMVLDSPDPINQSQASVLADTARGIASGPSLVRSALEQVGVRRDPVRFGEEHVDVRPLGSSGILRLVVTDADPGTAVAMSNAVAQLVIAARSRVTEGTAMGAVRSLEREIALLEDQLAKLDERIDALSAARARLSQDDAAKLRTAERSRDAATRRLGQLQGELVAIQGQRALRPQAGVIDAATTATPLPGRLVPDYLLGGLLGLVVGAAAAAGREALVPTVVGHAAMARALGAPVLADLSAPPDRCSRKDAGIAARYIELAAGAADVDRVEVLCLERDVDVTRLIDLLDEELTTTTVHEAHPWRGRDGAGGPGGKDDRRRALGTHAAERASGLVVVVPDVARLAALEPARNLQRITGWPLLGVVVFRRSSHYLPPRVARPRRQQAAGPRRPIPARQHGQGARL